MKIMTLILTIALVLNAFPKVHAQDKIAKATEVFEKVELLVMNGQKVKKLPARLKLEEKSLVVESRDSSDAVKRFDYDVVKSAEYSYSSHPRWKAGLGVGGGGAVLGAALMAGAGSYGAAYTGFFMLLFAPGAGWRLGKSKSRRHWLVIKTSDDHIVLRLDKNDYKYLLAAIETRTGVKVEDIGEKK